MYIFNSLPYCLQDSIHNYYHMKNIPERRSRNQINPPLSSPSQGGDFVVSAQPNDEGVVKNLIVQFFMGKVSLR